MAVKLIMPKLGMGMEEGTIVEWLKQEGDEVKKGDSVAVISSDKIEKDIEAPADGILLKIEASSDEVVKVGEAIGFVGAAGEEAEATNAPQAELHQEAPNMPEEIPVSIERTPEPAATKVQRNGGRTRISPAARKLARKHDLDVTGIPGTGPNGRITRSDVERHLNHNTQPAAAAVQPAPEADVEPMSSRSSASGKPLAGMRKVIAERMFDSLQTTAQLTITMRADVTDLMTIRKQMNESLAESGVKLTLTDFVAKAVIASLKKHPEMNATLENGQLALHDRVHLGIAVALDGGLMVPVINDACRLSLRDLSSRIRSNADDVRGGSIQAETLKGSTFTITNLGNYEVEFFTPVLNPPEIGILGLGRAMPEAVFVGDELQKRHIQPLSLTFDHRAIDGSPAAAFLQTLKGMLEQPYRMLAE
ncbi:dihydrolipoamide acetyltransferase family protein [Domibacillus sp. DTU_2020_1001157_1_SI_ALB_TIR_016]|uniref:dihydrolipoamide acetyltransferase family protein n=1 Tax=Domibacillus sp. DTU_2020_1001157_1_SI_ALB_TIR_016 TaxID=3077789 RepID=UPI0028EA0560|nr:dihydrolipoamide acetyltransferase family protein [Domibacillus sp. DTU_2020_1001157_1_SI_ALB_TIR_016]WNS81283.1 dihydrolipoamide acetyltransferase family protein [Domibacillus sp. DTU_2020_1001157_1_SI_ALB_TIR_016]